MFDIQRLVFFLLKLLCLMRTNANTERTICLTELLAFYYKSEKSCSFTKTFFMENFKDSPRTCLVTCTLKALTPDLKDVTRYELEKLEIKYANTSFTFTMRKPCGHFINTDVEIAMTCDERGFYDKRIGESCTTQSHCDVSNPYSTCNTSNAVCECKEGYFARFNTCFKKHLSIGDTCELNEQCLGNTGFGFCRQTEQGKVCSFLPESDYIRSSQHTGFQTNSLPNWTERSPDGILETTLVYSSKEMARTNDLPVGMIVGAAATGFVLGIIFCGIFYVILSRCKNSTSAKRYQRKDLRNTSTAKDRRHRLMTSITTLVMLPVCRISSLNTTMSPLMIQMATHTIV
ncbi:uncharacterized protein LOC125666895 isoform X3 [Ostrea edulis]|uniref:uncharacterized protein LOC125666895 isoform X3 n=1 Tax=Ostrea edulis TaxID=37623 RepID=UPI0024AFE66E|nr:uncharacterized protein LOC125666895 isoform X3 [Ostrea edulis]